MYINEEEKNKLIKSLKFELLNEIKKEIPIVKVYVEVCRPDVKLPEYANKGDAGMDIRAAEDIILNPSETKIIPTGLKMVVPTGYELQVRPRSGLSLKTPLRVANSPGTIDSGYKDEIGIIINNISINESQNKYEIDELGNKQGTYIIKKGDRIAQIILTEFSQIDFELVADIKNYGLNRGGGFGSSGVK